MAPRPPCPATPMVLPDGTACAPYAPAAVAGEQVPEAARRQPAALLLSSRWPANHLQNSEKTGTGIASMADAAAAVAFVPHQQRLPPPHRPSTQPMLRVRAIAAHRRLVLPAPASASFPEQVSAAPSARFYSHIKQRTFRKGAKSAVHASYACLPCSEVLSSPTTGRLISTLRCCKRRLRSFLPYNGGSVCRPSTAVLCVIPAPPTPA